MVYIKPYGTQLYGHRIETNKMFPKLCVKTSTLPRAGKGVVQEENIARGQEITKYGGEKIGEKDADERSKKVFKSNLKIVTVASNNKRFNRTYQGEVFHIKRIGGTDKYIDSKTSLECPMEKYVAEHQVAGFCNTKSIKRLCNAQFVTVDEEVFLVATRDIRRGEEISHSTMIGRHSKLSPKSERLPRSGAGGLPGSGESFRAVLEEPRGTCRRGGGDAAASAEERHQ